MNTEVSPRPSNPPRRLMFAPDEDVLWTNEEINHQDATIARPVNGTASSSQTKVAAETNPSVIPLDAATAKQPVAIPADDAERFAAELADATQDECAVDPEDQKSIAAKETATLAEVEGLLTKALTHRNGELIHKYLTGMYVWQAQQAYAVCGHGQFGKYLAGVCKEFHLAPSTMYNRIDFYLDRRTDVGNLLRVRLTDAQKAKWGFDPDVPDTPENVNRLLDVCAGDEIADWMNDHLEQTRKASAVARAAAQGAAPPKTIKLVGLSERRREAVQVALAKLLYREGSMEAVSGVICDWLMAEVAALPTPPSSKKNTKTRQRVGKDSTNG